MILTCPACATRFLVPDGAFGTSGRRRVRCGRCRHEWTAVSDQPHQPPATGAAPAIITGPTLAAFPEIAPRPVPAGSALPARTTRFSRVLARAAPRRRSVTALVLLFAILAAAVVLALTPAGTTMLQQMLVPATPLTIEQVTTRYVPLDTGPAADAIAAPTVEPSGVTASKSTEPAVAPTAWSLVVEGTVKNASDHAATVPPLILMTKDASGTLLGTYRPAPQLAEVPAHGSTGFTITLGAADPKLSEVTVQFASQ